MEELLEILQEQARKYPAMRPQDAVKLIYQNHFGSEEPDSDAAAIKASLQAEWETAEPDPSQDLTEEIGGHRVRMNLARARTLYTLEQVADWTFRSTLAPRGSLTEYLEKLKLVKKNFAGIGFPFSEEEWNAFLAYCRGNAYPRVQHSAQYLQAYHPHYRVLWQGIWEE